ncbi:hypothetical protein DCCM_3919 [Desulfocucumis palustris]|uniref:Phage metallopeptidase domain-containing protein n=1 Tax=Desulfocucumis palustris TaxID=1898651 RepID=A0A2L2XEK7_9FIRM|nr:hypothetical protein [Desulfocucumis palustris]GBF34799.1 hypothetical protein DCCM_3919 [Desulfocucumis palustris]
MTKKDILSLTSEIINKNTPVILNKLGFKEQPGYLKFKISESYDDALGMCFAIFKDDEKTQLQEAVIILYPFNMLWINFLDWIRLPRICKFSRRLFERKVLHVLAHELRHFWQYYTGEHKKYSRLSRFLPSKMRLIELDAEKWAEDFLTVYGLKPRIANLSF